MKAEIQKLWVEALRSGTYRKGLGTLRKAYKNKSDEFCCLGVLSDLAVKHGVEVKISFNEVVLGNPEKPTGVYAYDTTTTCLPNSVMEWAGLGSPDPKVKRNPSEVEDNLSNFNDLYDLPFSEIARLIEKQL